MRLSRQGHEESEWDDGREECVFCFCSLCVTSVRQEWLGHGQDAHKRNSGIRLPYPCSYTWSHTLFISAFSVFTVAVSEPYPYKLNLPCEYFGVN